MTTPANVAGGALSRVRSSPQGRSSPLSSGKFFAPQAKAARDGGLNDLETCRRHLKTLARIVKASNCAAWALAAFDKYEAHVHALQERRTTADRAFAILEDEMA